jgi:hypothetical protein
MFPSSWKDFKMSVVLRVAASNPLPNFDLSKVMARVSKKNPDWSVDRLANAELEYRRYLLLCRTYVGSRVSPSHDVDQVWHAHILHTQQYANDCNRFFGYFLHHEPFSGDSSEPRPKNNIARFYVELFGEPYMGIGMAECCECDPHEPGDSP